MALGRRCDTGCESWPPDSEFVRCPQCGEPTTVYNNLQPLDLDEAISIKRHLDFEAKYERHCEALGQGVDGPLSAAAEARLDALGGTDLPVATGRDA
jgi:hypothetical protein